MTRSRFFEPCSGLVSWFRPQMQCVTCARGAPFHGRFLRSDKILLQNSAILRNAVRTSLPLVSSEKHAAQYPEKLRKKLSLNYKSAALNQLSYAGVPHTKAVFREFIKSLSLTECSTRQFRRTTLLSVTGSQCRFKNPFAVRTCAFTLIQ